MATLIKVLGIEHIGVNNISNLLVTLNSSVNFIIYCIFGDKFKRIFLRLFCSQGSQSMTMKLKSLLACIANNALVLAYCNCFMV